MAFGVTLAGFVKPTEDEIETIVSEDFRTEFGESITLAPQTFLGQQSSIMKKSTKEFWDYLEGIYNSLFVSTSTGVNLDRTAFPFARAVAEKASVVLTFTGQDEAFIPAGSLAETAEGIQYETTEDATIEDSSGGEGTVDVNAIAVLAGASGNQAVGAITELPVTITDVDSVTNLTPATGGSEIESDPDFLARIKVESQTSKSSSVAAIRAALLLVEGVTQANVVENATDAVVDGLEPNSIYAVVSGTASDADIAQAIFESKAGGIGTNGSESYVVSLGTETYEINFDRSSLVNIYVDLILTVDATWDSDFADILKARVLEYIGGVDGEGIEYPGLLAGVDVLSWKIIASLFNLENPDELGITDISVELSRFEDPSSTETSNIAIAATEKAVTDLSFITVTVL